MTHLTVGSPRGTSARWWVTTAALAGLAYAAVSLAWPLPGVRYRPLAVAIAVPSLVGAPLSAVVGATLGILESAHGRRDRARAAALASLGLALPAATAYGQFGLMNSLLGCPRPVVCSPTLAERVGGLGAIAFLFFVAWLTAFLWRNARASFGWGNSGFPPPDCEAPDDLGPGSRVAAGRAEASAFRASVG